MSLKNKIVNFATVNPSELQEHPLNFRVHPKQQIEGMSGILDEIGWLDAIKVNVNTGTIVDGHMRLRIALEKQEEEVPVIYLDLTEEEEKKALLTINPIATFAKENSDKIQQLIDIVSISDERMKSIVDKYARRNGAETPEDKEEAQEDDADLNVLIKDEEEYMYDGQVIRRGQMWNIESQFDGKFHKIFCGDSANKNDVSRLFDGSKKAVLINTDPPYGIDYEEFGDAHNNNTNYKAIEGDNLKGDSLERFLIDCYSAWIPYLEKNSAWYIWMPFKNMVQFMNAMIKVDILMNRLIIWDKTRISFSMNSLYHWQQEQAIFGWLKGNMPNFYGSNSQSTVWNVPVENRTGRIHPMQKPLKLFEIPIKNHTKEGDIIIEPFSGSGSQYVCADQFGRIVHGMEIEPKYVKCVLDRMNLIGRKSYLEYEI